MPAARVSSPSRSENSVRRLAALLCAFFASASICADELTLGDGVLTFTMRLSLHTQRARAAEAAGDRLRAAHEWNLVCNYVRFLTFHDGVSCSRAVELARAVGHPEVEAYEIADAALFLGWSSKWAASARRAADALALAAGHDDAVAVRLAHLVLGGVAGEQGDYDRALAELRTTIRLAERAGDLRYQAVAHIWLGRTEIRVGDYRSGRLDAQRGLELAAAIADLDNAAQAEWMLGLADMETGQVARALPHLLRMRDEAQAVGNQWLVVTARVDIVQAMAELGRLDEAQRLVDELHADLVASKMPASMPNVLKLEGIIAEGRGDHAAAAATFRRVADQATQQFLSVSALLERARALAKLGDRAGARAAYEETIAHVESDRRRAPADLGRARFLAANGAAYRELVALLSDEGGPDAAERAFAVAEAGRGRSLLDALEAAGGTARPDETQPLGAAAAAALLGPGELLIEYVTTGERLYGFAVGPRGVRMVELGAGADLAARVDYYRQLVEEAAGPGELATAGRRLSADLVRPLLDGTEAPATLVIAPDGPLYELPFDALVGDDGRFLGERTVIVQTPSASLLRAAAGAPTRPALLVVADAPSLAGLPPLPFSRIEAAGVLGAVRDGELRVGAATSEAALKAHGLGGYAVLHFATHAFVDEGVPGRSALVLGAGDGEDGFLRAAEIDGLALDADLVVLSGCRTGVGPLAGGEGALSLARAFRHAGARAVVSTLWPISDRRSVRLMERFYRGLADGARVAEALAAAKRAAIAAGERPSTWAAFVLSAPRGAATAIRPAAAPSLIGVAVLLGIAALGFVSARRV